MIKIIKQYRWLIIGLSVLSAWIWFNVNSVHAASDPTNLTPTKAYVVNDYAHILTPQLKHHIFEQNELFQKTKQKPQVIVITVKSTDGKSAPDFAKSVLSHSQWNLGKRGADNGVLILYALNVNNHTISVLPGYGSESILPDLSITQMLSTNYNLLNSGNNSLINYGIQAMFDGVSQILMNHANQTIWPTSNQFQIGGGGGPGMFFELMTFLFITCGGPFWLLYRSKRDSNNHD